MPENSHSPPTSSPHPPRRRSGSERPTQGFGAARPESQSVLEGQGRCGVDEHGVDVLGLRCAGKVRRVVFDTLALRSFGLPGGRRGGGKSGKLRSTRHHQAACSTEREYVERSEATRFWLGGERGGPGPLADA